MLNVVLYTLLSLHGLDQLMYVAKGFVSILKLFLLSCKLALWIIYITLNAYRITLCNIYRIVKVQKKIDYVTSMFISILD